MLILETRTSTTTETTTTTTTTGVTVIEEKKAKVKEEKEEKKEEKEEKEEKKEEKIAGGRTDRRMDQPKVVQEVLADLKICCKEVSVCDRQCNRSIY